MQQIHHVTHHVTIAGDVAFNRLFDALTARHTRALRLPEIRRALQALSTIYVQRRDKLQAGLALQTPGKRAAFALYYAPLHLLCLRAIMSRLPLLPCKRLVDVGCGTGAASLAYAQTFGAPPQTLGIDGNAWALREATHAWQLAGVCGKTLCSKDLPRALRPGDTALLAFVLNELDDVARRRLWRALEHNAQQVLVVEPIARRAAPWFPDWETAFVAAGGRSDVWHIHLKLPEVWRVLDHAAGMRHDLVKLRSLYMTRHGELRRSRWQ